MMARLKAAISKLHPSTPRFACQRRSESNAVYLFQWVRSVDAYHREIVDRGAEVIEEPADRPCNIRDFAPVIPMGF